MGVNKVLDLAQAFLEHLLFDYEPHQHLRLKMDHHLIKNPARILRDNWDQKEIYDSL